jgi:Animal haem peroxidase
MKRFVCLILLVSALTGLKAFGQSVPTTDTRLDLFIRVLSSPSNNSATGAPTTPQPRLEQILAEFPPMTMGHGGGPPLVAGLQTTTTTGPDPSFYGFCYEACRTERASGSCGTPAPGQAQPPTQMCEPIEFDPTLSAIIGPQLGTGASPFVDDNKSADLNQQPAGYTFLGQFIDHDVTRTQTALQALSVLNVRVQSDASTRGKLAAAGITLDQLQQAIADAAAPTSTLSVNTGKLDLDSVYGVADFAALTGITAAWFEQSNGTYTGRFAMRHVQAPASIGTPIDGFDYERAQTGAAEIPDPRNSEHKLIVQIQNLFELAHNDCMDHALGSSSAPSQLQIGTAFDACHKKVIWTYETIVATDFLPRFSTEATLNRVAPGALHAYQRGTTPTSHLPHRNRVETYLYSCSPEHIGIPHEFAVAAFRLGHTLVRDEYVLHDPVLDSNGNRLTGQPRPIFAAAGVPETVGLVGDNPVQPGDVVDWSHFYDVYGFGQQDESAQPGRPVDTLISDRLFNLPIAALPPGPDANGKDTSTERNLPRRNLMRAAEPTSVITGSVGLATGEEMEVYAQRRIPGLHDSTNEVRKVLAAHLQSAGFAPNLLAQRTPLWLFILAEAESTQASQRLGELGSHIIDEFLLGSLQCDQGSVLYAAASDLQGWNPTETIAQNGAYSVPELIRYLQANAKLNGQPIRLFGD